MTDFTNSKVRVKALLAKVNELEAHLNYLDSQKFLLSLGLKSDYVDIASPIKDAENCLATLDKILGEIKFIKRMVQLDFEICLN